MVDFSEQNNSFEKQMNEFLDGVSDDNEKESATGKDDIDVNQFLSDENQVADTSPQSGAGVTSAPQQTQRPNDYMTQEQIAYEIRLAEERGKVAGINSAMATIGKPASDQPQQAQQGFYKPEEIEFTPEERSFDEQALSFAEKVARRELNRVLETVVSPLQRVVQEQAQQLASYNEGVARTNAKVLYSQVQAIVPDLPNVVESPEWKQYLNQQNPFDSSITMADTFRSHLMAGRTSDLVNIINQFKSQRPSGRVQEQVSPGRSSVSTPPTSPATNGKPLFSKAKYDEALAAWQAGNITYAAFSKISDLYQEAALEGRVVDR